MAMRGRKVAIAVGIIALLVMGLAAHQRRRLEVQYYFLCLRHDPTQFLKFCKASSSPPKREALRQFFRTPQGKDSLLQTYLEAALGTDQNLDNSLDEIQTYSGGAWLLVWLQENGLRRMRYFDSPNGSIRGSGNFYRDQLVDPLLSTLQSYLSEVGYDRHPLPRVPELTFSVVTRTTGQENILGSFMAWKDWTEGRVGLIERVRRQLPREVR